MHKADTKHKKHRCPPNPSRIYYDGGIFLESLILGMACGWGSFAPFP